MYFNEKGNTNIDDQFKGTKKLNLSLNLKKPKILFFIGGGILLLVIIIIIIVINSNKTKLELLGDGNITITIGSNYIEPGYKAYDKDDNDITSKVEIKNNLDISKEGEYEITYSIDGITKKRYVTVVEGVNETYISLSGNMKMYLEVGEKYQEPGYKVFDSTGQDLTEKVKVTGSVDTSKVGTYQLTYSVVNSKNITTTEKRTIIVVEKGKKPKN